MNRKQLEAMRYVANEKQKAYYRAAEEAERQRLASRSGTSTSRDHNRTISAIAMLMVNMLDEAIRHAPEEPPPPQEGHKTISFSPDELETVTEALFFHGHTNDVLLAERIEKET